MAVALDYSEQKYWQRQATYQAPRYLIGKEYHANVVDGHSNDAEHF